MIFRWCAYDLLWFSDDFPWIQMIFWCSMISYDFLLFFYGFHRKFQMVLDDFRLISLFSNDFLWFPFFLLFFKVIFLGMSCIEIVVFHGWICINLWFSGDFKCFSDDFQIFVTWFSSGFPGKECVFLTCCWCAMWFYWRWCV